jgi:hypothetical protein
MKTKMTQTVQWTESLACTPRELLDRGLGEVKKIGTKGPTLINLKGTMRGVEVSGYVAAKA